MLHDMFISFTFPSCEECESNKRMGRSVRLFKGGCVLPLLFVHREIQRWECGRLGRFVVEVWQLGLASTPYEYYNGLPFFSGRWTYIGLSDDVAIDRSRPMIYRNAQLLMNTCAVGPQVLSSSRVYSWIFTGHRSMSGHARMSMLGKSKVVVREYFQPSDTV